MLVKMPINAWLLISALFTLAALQSCGGELPPTGGLPPLGPGHLNNTGSSTASLERTPACAYSKTLSATTLKILKQNDMAALGLLGLLGMWLLVRAYEVRRQREPARFRTQDLALLKIALDNLGRIWKDHRPGRKVVRLEEWRR